MGSPSVYGVLKVLEERGQVRRGYFVAGLGAAQFALPGAVDRLRAAREPDDDADSAPLVLAATDPAQPYGAALAWPETGGPAGAGRPARSSCSPTGELRGVARPPRATTSSRSRRRGAMATGPTGGCTPSCSS